jgi:uncharacterized protein (TIGR03067 family)
VKNLLWVAAVFGLLAVIGPTAAEGKKADDAKAIQGTWTVERFEVSGGGGPPADELKKMRLTFKDDTLELSFGGDMKKTAKFKLMGDKKPKQIDLTPSEGPEAGKTAPGIYELSGDTLKLCFADKEGMARPTEFSAKGDRVVYFVLKREKK